MPTDYERVRSAILYLAERAPEQPSLEDVAEHVGLSPSHFQRVFTRWAGVSPKRYVQYLSAVEAKRLLRESQPVLDTAFEVGLSGSGRLHDLMVTVEAMTPGEYARGGEGVSIVYGVHESPFGPCLIALTDRGVCALRFSDDPDAADAVAALAVEWPRADVRRDDGGTAEVVDRIFGSLDADEPLSLALKGTNFQLRVWEALLSVPEHALISYSDLAARIGEPRATRAVASAVGANPVAYVIPCHRVLRST
ncbi:MAG: methylated-DNA--[protein]-cysteine S-methyltransferase, partial [Actinobacteria bacterium]